jgi:hypothetical protein
VTCWSAAASSPASSPATWSCEPWCRCFSYLGTFSFGLTGDDDVAPDLTVLREGIGRGLAELGKEA